MTCLFTSVEGVKAAAGFSVAPKKNGVDSRKLLMRCSTNYAWKSGKDGSDFGILGGTALSSCHVPKDASAVAVCDESAAFTSIRTPSWMLAWFCSPPMRRKDVPLRYLTPELRSLSDTDWAYLRYERLARRTLRAHHYVHQSSCHWAVVDSRQGLPRSAASTDD